MPAQASLFDLPVLPGLRHGEAIVSCADADALVARLAGVALAPFRFQGWTGRRLTASFGWRYDFEDARFGPTEPIPAWLLPLRADAARFAGLDRDALAQALVTRYDPGAGIGWHRDRPVFGQVVGISLGAPALLRFRRRTPGGFERASLPLAPRSIYHLDGVARSGWEHGIAPIAETRWSITFRTLADAAAGPQRGPR